MTTRAPGLHKIPEDIHAELVSLMNGQPADAVTTLPVYDSTPDPEMDAFRRLDLRSHLARLHNIRVNSNGLTLCPFHNDTEPSFSVYQKDGLWKWKCHGKCSAGGDIFDFYTTFKEMSLPEAIKTVRELEGITEAPTTTAPTMLTSKKTDPPKDAKIVLQPMSDIESRETVYIMQNRIPLAMFTLLSGEGGVGKSSVLTEIACRVSRGDPLPGATEPLVPAGSTIYMTTENQPSEVFRPRVIAAGGDLTKIYYARHVLIPVDNEPDKLQVIDLVSHLPLLSKAIHDIGDVRILAIDPCISHLNEKVDDWRAKPVRQVIDTLGTFAEEHGIVIVGVVHSNKSVATTAANKVSGSNQWVNASRVAISIAPDKDDIEGNRYILGVIKANIFATFKGLPFRIINTSVIDPDAPQLKLQAGRVVFETEEIDIDIQALFNPERREESMTTKAIRLFNNELKNGPRPAEEIWLMAQTLGISEGSYKYARKKRGIYAEKLGGKFGQDGEEAKENWVLWLPEQWEAYHAARKKS